MAYSKVILNGTTLIDVTDKTVTAATLLNGETALKNDGTSITGAYVPPTCTLQSKTATPATSQQTITPDTGYDGLSSVTVNAMPSGSATTPATSITANPTISVSAGGLITASVSGSQSVTPTVSAGYVASGTAGNITVSGSNTNQLTTQAAQTITPTATAQTIASGKYLTGNQTIEGVICTNLTAENIAEGVTVKIGTATDDDSVASITGTHSGGGGDKTVDISLWIPSAPSYFKSFTIYETTAGVRGNQIGSIATPDGSTTVTVSASATGLECECIGDYVSPSYFFGDYGMIGDIGVTAITEGTAVIGFAVASSGTIEIQRIDWSD